MKPALFLDRDGVINVDHAYVHTVESFEFVDGIFDLCRYAISLGYSIFVVTNQAGIGRGYYSEQDFQVLTQWMQEAFRATGAPIDRVYYCPTHPVHGVGEFRRESPMRKPHPGMILKAAEEFAVDLNNSVLIGDKESDILAGRAAGISCNLLYVTKGLVQPATTLATAVVTRLVDARNFLQSAEVR